MESESGMKIEIVTIGDEVLSGSTIDTNSSFIAKTLKNRGYTISRHTTLPDRLDVMQKELENALLRADLVITTGGLGPTFDDITKKILVTLFDTELIYDESIAQDLQQRFPDLSTIENQASVPKNAQIIANSVGTAPGFILEKNSVLIALPGVPQEMRSMFYALLPYIEKRWELPKKYFEKKMNLCLVHEWQVEPYILQWQKKIPKMQWGIYPFFGGVQIQMKMTCSDGKEADKAFHQIEQKIIQTFPDEVYSSEDISLAEALHRALLEKKETVALGESCSGGALASVLTKIPGISATFLGSVVAYSNRLKQQILHVSAQTLEEKGAVSENTVEEMVEGLFKITDSDYAASISGIAGPEGGSKEKPVGTVWIAIGKKGEGIDSFKIEAPGDRLSVIDYCVNIVLGLLWRKVKHNRTHHEAKLFSYR